MKRYDFTGCDLDLYETENGEWVKANEAERQIKELEDEIKGLIKGLEVSLVHLQYGFAGRAIERIKQALR
jgi:hypothetical protein